MLSRINRETGVEALATSRIGVRRRPRDGRTTGGVYFMHSGPADEIGGISRRYTAAGHDRYSGSAARDQLGDAISTLPGAWGAAGRQYPLKAKVYGGIQRHV
jgi:hypothetical protein